MYTMSNYLGVENFIVLLNKPTYKSKTFSFFFFFFLRDGMGREEGGGFGMGNTCIPVADSF